MNHSPRERRPVHGVARPLSGFTLLEVMIVIAILGILAAVAAPSMRDMLVSSKVRTAASDLYGSVVLARSEAIKRSANVDVIPAAAGWQGGWTVKVGSTLLESREAVTDVTIAPNVAGNITFRLDGRVSTNLRTIILSTTSSAIVPARCVLIDAAGRPGVKTDTDNNAANGCQ